MVEGIKMFSELPKERVQAVYVTDKFLELPGSRNLLNEVKRVELVTEEVLKAMSDTQTPQGVLALVKQYEYRLEDILGMPGPAHIIILETIQDPGNLGTILRAGEGAGITGVIMNCSTADIYNPKTIRSTMGSIYRVPFVYADDFHGVITLLKNRNIHLYAAHLAGKKDYDEEDYQGASGFLIGNEANGLKEETAGLADSFIRIPMLGHVESLNAAVAASILMFETARQRRKGYLKQ